MDVTECINCETDPTHFRVLVDLETECGIGVVCAACLTTAFGDTIDSPAWRYDEGCAVCGRGECYGLTTVSVHRENRGDGVATSRFEYVLDDGTVSLCNEHVTWLTAESIEPRPVVTDGGV